MQQLKKKNDKRMPRGIKIVLNLIVCVLPWFLKKCVLTRIYGYVIEDSAKIGLSYIFPQFLFMGKGSRIGHFNVGVNLDTIMMKNNSYIGRGNWITGLSTFKESKFFSHQVGIRKSELIIGEESAITKNHHIDCTNSIIIGKYVTIAGYYSQLLTHSIDVYAGRQNSKPIEIGDYCFVSTGVKILGGTKLPAYSLLAAGAVLTKKYECEWGVYAGIPAKLIKSIPKNAQYFNRINGVVF